MSVTIEEKEITLDNNNFRKVAVLSIDNPPINPLSTKTLEDLSDSIKTIEANSEISLVILQGAGNKAFVAGADVKEMQNMNTKMAQEYVNKAHTLFSHLESSNKLFIACIQGYTLGGGLELALACDIRIASDDSIFAFPEASLGLLPGFGGTQRTPLDTGLANTLYYILTTKKFSAKQALELGLIQELHTADVLPEKLMELCKVILANGPQAITNIKQLLYKTHKKDMQANLALETKYFSQLFSTTEPNEGISAFLEKRPASFS